MPALTDLLSFLFVPIRARTVDGEDGDATVVRPPVALPTQLRGDVPIFDDEVETPQEDLVVIDSTHRQFQSFFEAISDGGLLEAARRDLEFSRRISLFAIGVLFSIEQDINIFSDRGKSMVSSVLRFFIDSHEAVGHFVQTMERYLTASDAPEAIRLGSKCFKLYQNADIAGVRRTFEEAFNVTDKLEAGLGGKVKVGILFTDIVDSTKMTSEIGDDAAQQVIDHHEEVVLDFCRRFGGRKVKHLGDGLMLRFANKEKMVGCAVAVVDAMKGIANRPDAPVYQIRCGGHFGEAIQKEDDFFGSTVQMAARISAKAGTNEACFSTILFDRDLPTYSLFQDRGAIELKGIAQPVALAIYS
jgi:class 3 adenylate cyclase